MKIRLLTVFSLVLILSIVYENKSIGNPKPQRKYGVVQIAQKKADIDTIPFDKINFNGLEFWCSISQAKLKLGQRDSIAFVHEEMSCYEPDTFFYYFKGYAFNLKDDSLVFSSADFSDKSIEISTPNLKVTYKTQINEVLKAYLVPDDNMTHYLNSDGRDVFFIKVPQEKMNVSSEAFIFTFINKKLVKFEYWFDCS